VTDPEPGGGGAFVAIDLDNVLGDSFDPANPTPYPPRKMQKLLDTIEQHAGLPIRGGFAAMNEVTATAISSETLNLLTAKGITHKKVLPRREEADKYIFMAIGRAEKEFDTFVVCSGDAGFVEAVLTLRENKPEAVVYVAVDQQTRGLRERYARVEGMKFIEVNPRPAPTRPTPGAAARRPAADKPTNPDQPAPARAEAKAVGYVLICDLCGRRCLQSSAAKRDLCRWCGAQLRTDQSAIGIVPAGKRPFTDGAVIEIWYRGSHKRTAVLCGQSTSFGRELKYAKSSSFVPLGDLVDEKNKISREQFSVSREGDDRDASYYLFRPSRINEDGEESTKPLYVGPDKVLLPVNNDVELQDGTEFWVNQPGYTKDAGALLRCVFRTAPAEDIAEGEE
jgi:hypothetical protein